MGRLDCRQQWRTGAETLSDGVIAALSHSALDHRPTLLHRSLATAMPLAPDIVVISDLCLRRETDLVGL